MDGVYSHAAAATSHLGSQETERKLLLLLRNNNMLHYLHSQVEFYCFIPVQTQSPKEIYWPTELHLLFFILGKITIFYKICSSFQNSVSNGSVHCILYMDSIHCFTSEQTFILVKCNYNQYCTYQRKILTSRS